MFIAVVIDKLQIKMSRKITEKMFSLVFWEDLNTHSVIKTSSIKRTRKDGKPTARKNNKSMVIQILLQDDDKEYLEMIDVDGNGKIILNKIKRSVDKEWKKVKKIKTCRIVDPKINDKEIISTKSIFDVDPKKTSIPTSKRRVSGITITSSDEDNEPDKVRVVPRNNNKNASERRASGPIFTSSDNDSESDGMRAFPREYAIPHISLPSTSKISTTNKTDLIKVPTLSTKTNTNDSLSSTTDEDSECEDVQMKSKKLFVEKNKNIESIPQKNKFRIGLVHYSSSSEDSEGDNDNHNKGNCHVAVKKIDDNFSKIDDDIEEVKVIEKNNKTNNKSTKKDHNENLEDKKQKLQGKYSFTHSLDSFENEENLNLKASSDEIRKIKSIEGKSAGTEKLDESDDDDDELRAEDFELFKQFLKFKRSNKRQLVKSSARTRQMKKIVNTKKEVELIKGSGIMISEYQLLMITKYNTKKAGQMIRKLFRLVLGEEKLSQMVPLKPKEGRELIPENISEAIFEYVNANVNKGHEVNVTEFQGIVGTMCCTIRDKFKGKSNGKND